MVLVDLSAVAALQQIHTHSECMQVYEGTLYVWLSWEVSESNSIKVSSLCALLQGLDANPTRTAVSMFHYLVPNTVVHFAGAVAAG